MFDGQRVVVLQAARAAVAPTVRYSSALFGGVVRYGKDAEGHEHGSDGRFVDQSGGKTSDKTDSGATVSDKPKKAKSSSIDTPAQGSLALAKKVKKQAMEKVKSIREKLVNEPIGGNRYGLQLELMKAKSAHNEALLMEKQAKDGIEKRANELGQTRTV